MSDKPGRLLPICLAFAGTIPFLFGAVMLAAGRDFVPVLGDLSTMVGIYGLVIASFMAGVHWGQHLDRQDRWSLILPVTSNIIAILLWLGWLNLTIYAFILLLCLAFLALLLVDWRLRRAQVIDPAYWFTRLAVTGIVVLSLLLTFVSIFIFPA